MLNEVLKKLKQKYLGEVIRFCIVGCASALCLYLVYYVLLHFLNHSLAYSIGYFVSFLLNYVLSLVFTFKEKSEAKKFFGFALSHVINFFLQIVLLNLFIYIGVNEKIAPIPVLAICVPTNFVLVRYFIKKH